MPLKHKNTKKSHTNNFVGFRDLVFLWQKSIFEMVCNKKLILFTALLALSMTAGAQKRKVDTIPWHDGINLTWDDFKGTPDEGMSYFAYTDYMITLNCSFNQNTLNVTIGSYFDRLHSWVKKGKEKDSLLLHEKAHFAIAEIYARKERKTLTDTVINQSNVSAVLNFINTKAMQDCHNREVLYDDETNHSIITAKQIEWLQEVYKELDELKAYSNTVVQKTIQ